MKTEYLLVCACLLTLFRCSEEMPFEEPSHDVEEEKQMQRNASYSGKEDVDSDNSSSRWNHARMRNIHPSTTTMGYDDWWFLTTPRRPFLSYRDFPGKPGVATWKEISPGVAAVDKKKKVSSPTAAEVSSGAPEVFCNVSCRSVLALITLVSMHRCFRWT